MKIKKKEVIYILFFLILLFLISFKPRITGMEVVRITPTDITKPECEGICCFKKCEDNIITCPDGYKSKCKNTCNPKTGECSSCQPLCFEYPTEDYSLEGIYKGEGGSISRRTLPCINVSNIEKDIIEIKEEELVEIPKGYSIILKPFSFECNGDIDLTVSIPNNFIDVKALKCKKNRCYPAKIFNVNNLECGIEIEEVSREINYLKPEFMTINITETKLDLSDIKKKIKSGKNEINFYGDIKNLSVIMRMPSQPIKEAKNPSLKIIGTPLVIKLNNINSLNSTITMPYIEEENIEKDSYAIYVKKNDLWNYIGGEIKDKTITANIVSIEKYANENNEIVFAVMGILCTDCLISSFKKIYDNGKDAIILIHGFMSSPKTYQELIDDVVLTKQPYQVWTFGYPTVRDIKKNAKELSYYLEANKNEYDNIYIIGHSLGGIIAQQAFLFNSKKVKKVILVAVPNEGSPAAKVYEKLINQLINSEKYKVYDPRNIVKDLIKGIITPKVEEIEYYVIAGTKSYILTEDLFDLTNDGIVTVKSAQHIGDSYINDKCKNYWEIYDTHTKLIDDVLPRKIIEKIISQDLNEISILGNNQYFKLVDKCFPGDKYLFIGKEIEKEEIADPSGCSCGNNVCGVDEDEISCPSDCISKFSYWFFSFIFIIIIIGIIFYIIRKEKEE